jgi:EAL domain-containing protein (putative c-di-GMP-specific phosphodiesterase class I)/CheY-like chemotaxis protein
MRADTAEPTLAASGPAARPTMDTGPASRAPLCFVVDDDASIRHFLSLVLHGAGLDAEEFADGQAFRVALGQRAPDLVFLNIALESADSIECVVALGKKQFTGYLQLMSSRGSAVLEHVKSIGLQHHLQVLNTLKKPFETSEILRILREVKLGHPPALAGRIKLEDALRNDWVEFWYQPKIDLRKKQLVGVEAFARVRHPQHGLMLPGAFMPGASESSVITLSELALERGLSANLNFAKLGLVMRLAVNIPVNALLKVPVADIVRAHRPKFDKWPGLIIDVTEEQVITNLDWAIDMARQFRPLNISLAIDDFGRGYSALTRVKELPFAELKLDRIFVTDCGTDKVNAPLCKTVIDLAHSFGSLAVGIGIEKASEALALVSMGCDYGQGFLLGQPMPEDRFISLLRLRAASQGRRLSA